MQPQNRDFITIKSWLDRGRHTSTIAITIMRSVWAIDIMQDKGNLTSL